MSDINAATNDTTQAAIDRLREPVHTSQSLRGPADASVVASRQVSSFAALTSSATMRDTADKLAKVREGIQSLGSAIDSATVSMEALWAQIQRDREQLADLRRSEAMHEASLNKAREPSFTR